MVCIIVGIQQLDNLGLGSVTLAGLCKPLSVLEAVAAPGGRLCSPAPRRTPRRPGRILRPRPPPPQPFHRRHWRQQAAAQEAAVPQEEPPSQHQQSRQQQRPQRPAEKPARAPDWNGSAARPGAQKSAGWAWVSPAEREVPAESA